MRWGTFFDSSGFAAPEVGSRWGTFFASAGFVAPGAGWGRGTFLHCPDFLAPEGGAGWGTFSAPARFSSPEAGFGWRSLGAGGALGSTRGCARRDGSQSKVVGAGGVISFTVRSSLCLRAAPGRFGPLETSRPLHRARAAPLEICTFVILSKSLAQFLEGIKPPTPSVSTKCRVLPGFVRLTGLVVCAKLTPVLTPPPTKRGLRRG